MRERAYFKEELFIQRDFPLSIIIAKNLLKTVKYFVSVRLWEEIIWQIHGNNSEDIVNNLHTFFIKNWLIHKDKVDETNSLLQNKTELFLEDINKEQYLNVIDENKFKNKLQVKKLISKKDLQIVKKELEEIFKNGFRNEGIDVYSKKEGVLFYSNTHGELTISNNTIEFWKELIVTYLLALSERAKWGFEIPELANIVYNSWKSINIYINHFLERKEVESFNPNEEEHPFNLCDCEDYYVNKPSLICWVDNLFWDLWIKEVECFFW